MPSILLLPPLQPPSPSTTSTVVDVDVDVAVSPIIVSVTAIHIYCMSFPFFPLLCTSSDTFSPRIPCCSLTFCSSLPHSIHPATIWCCYFTRLQCCCFFIEIMLRVRHIRHSCKHKMWMWVCMCCLSIAKLCIMWNGRKLTTAEKMDSWTCRTMAAQNNTVSTNEQQLFGKRSLQFKNKNHTKGAHTRTHQNWTDFQMQAAIAYNKYRYSM